MYIKTNEVIAGTSGGTTQAYSNYYLNGYLMELGLSVASTLPITTGAPIQLYRDSADAHNLILETVCPATAGTWRPRFELTSSSTTGGVVALSSWIAAREPMLFAKERILCLIGQTSKPANIKFDLVTRTDGTVEMLSSSVS